MSDLLQRLWEAEMTESNYARIRLWKEARSEIESLRRGPSAPPARIARLRTRFWKSAGCDAKDIASNWFQRREQAAVSDQTERYYAEMEAARNDAEGAYFKARPQADTISNRTAFRAGFERAFSPLWHRLNATFSSEEMQTVSRLAGIAAQADETSAPHWNCTKCGGNPCE